MTNPFCCLEIYSFRPSDHWRFILLAAEWEWPWQWWWCGPRPFPVCRGQAWKLINGSRLKVCPPGHNVLFNFSSNLSTNQKLMNVSIWFSKCITLHSWTSHPECVIQKCPEQSADPGSAVLTRCLKCPAPSCLRPNTAVSPTQRPLTWHPRTMRKMPLS